MFALVGATLAIYSLRLAYRSTVDNDILRMLQLAHEHGTPYRDYQVEYAPIEFLLIRLFAGQAYATVALRVGLASLTGVLVGALGVGYGWGRRSAAVFLAFALPLTAFMVLRLEPVLVALAVWGFALDRRNRSRSGGALIALAILAKVWPLFLVPALVIQRRSRTLAWLSACLLVGGGVWVLVGGVRAPVEVVSFRGATGWEFESTVGALVWALTGGPPFEQSGTARIGLATWWETGLLLGVLILAWLIVWRNARYRKGDLLGAPALAVVGILLFLSPLFSLQYALWLAPWASVSWEEPDRMPARLAGAVCLATSVLWMIYAGMSYSTGSAAIIQTVVILRNSVCGLLALLFVTKVEPAVSRDRTSA